MSELKLCPFCGSADLYKGTTDFVACETCGAEGPFRDQANWNTRPGEDAAWNAALDAAAKACTPTGYSRYTLVEIQNRREIAAAIRAMKKGEG